VPENLREQNDEDFAADEEEAEEEDIAPVARQHNTRTIEIERFLPAGQIDARYFEKPYYLVPREMIGQESFAVIRDAMSREGVIGLSRIVLSSRRTVSDRADGRGASRRHAALFTRGAEPRRNISAKFLR
jgi:DNA end-binding protein Ku